ncbi:MAG: hypothetical protein QXW86_07325 [Saccharolobus sp.]|uniref:hypothetical protein n=1 Tax=Saccharolobus sp. TaxID=2100761 RepID=UPI00317D1EEF
MKRVLELGLPFLLIFTYMKIISLSGLASVMLIRRWSMLKPLNMVFLNDYLDTLIVSVATLILMIFLAYRYKSLQTYVLLVVSTLSLILSVASHLYSSAILSFITILYLIVYVLFIVKNAEFTEILRTFFSAILLICFLSFSGWILYLTYGGINPYRDPIPLQDIGTKLLYSFSPSVPIIAIIFLSMPLLIFVLKPLTPIEGSKPAEIFRKFKQFLRRLEVELNNLHGRMHVVWSIIFFALALLIPIFITLILYTDKVNPSNMVIGVDIMNYVNNINDVLSRSSTETEVFVNLMKTDRPLSLLLIYHISKLLNINIKTFSMYAPCFLAPLLALTTYFFSKNILKNNLYASLTSFMVSLGPYTTASLYGGFLANWIGMSLTLVSITILFKALERRSFKILTASIVLSILSHLSHPIPWSFMTATTVVYGLFSFFKKNKDRLVLRFLWIYALTNIFFDIFKTRVIGFSGASFVAQSTISAELSIENLLNFWQINVFMFYFHVGGAFNFPPVYILAILGMSLFLQWRSMKTDYLKTWIVISLPLYLLGPDFFQARTLQNIPIDFFASAGAMMVFYYLSQRDRISANLFLLLILLTYLNNILTFTVNLPF